MQSPTTRQVIIIGAGISGLILAQYLRKSFIPFQIFERDASLDARPGGWGLTLHWSLPALRELLPPEIVSKLPEAYVNKEAARTGDNGRFQFFDLHTARAKYDVPAAERIRVSRSRLKKILVEGIGVQYSKNLSSIESTDSSVTAHFSDGSTCTGTLLAACDGARSKARQTVYPDNAAMNPIPVRLLGASTQYSTAHATAARVIDPYIFQGTSSIDNTTDKYTCQVILSWPCKRGFFGQEEPIDIPSTKAGQLELMKRFSDSWAEPFRSLVHGLPHDAEIVPLSLENWYPPHGIHGKGRTVLVGDSAHTMTMFRGEGANHAIVDVLDFIRHLGPFFPRDDSSYETDFNKLRHAIDQYEDAVNARAIPSVLASRQACLDANEFEKVNDESPLVTRRVIKRDD